MTSPVDGGRWLLLDAGNSALKWGLLEHGEIHKAGRIAHERLQETGFAALVNRVPKDIDGAMLSNVAGNAFATKLAGVIGLHAGIDLKLAHCSKSAHGVTNGYSVPRKLGVDRWVAMIGAWNGYHKPLIVADAGTALTIDVVDGDGRHLGGQILPGLDLMQATLSRSTSDIPPTNARRDPGEGLAWFGRKTADAVRSGALAAACGAIAFADRRLRDNGLRAKIVLTGGDASRILKQLNVKAIHRPHLVLEGLSVMLTSDA